MKNNVTLKLGNLFDEDLNLDVRLDRLSNVELASKLRNLEFPEMAVYGLGLIKGGPAITTGNASNTDHDGDTTETGLSWTTAEGKGKFRRIL